MMYCAVSAIMINYTIPADCSILGSSDVVIKLVSIIKQGIATALNVPISSVLVAPGERVHGLRRGVGGRGNNRHAASSSISDQCRERSAARSDAIYIIHFFFHLIILDNLSLPSLRSISKWPCGAQGKSTQH